MLRMGTGISTKLLVPEPYHRGHDRLPRENPSLPAGKPLSVRRRKISLCFLGAATPNMGSTSNELRL